jgi:hypothetical protein
MLLKEKLEDQAVKQKHLELSVSKKKLELMAALKTKLSSVGRVDADLDRQIVALSERTTALEAELTPPQAAEALDDTKKPAKPVKRSAALNVVRS